MTAHLQKGIQPLILCSTLLQPFLVGSVLAGHLITTPGTHARHNVVKLAGLGKIEEGPGSFKDGFQRTWRALVATDAKEPCVLARFFYL